MGGLPNIAELDQVPLEMEDLSVGHMHIKKEEYFEEFDLNANNSNEDLRILRANYDNRSTSMTLWYGISYQLRSIFLII